jgi:hypothetical protein
VFCAKAGAAASAIARPMASFEIRTRLWLVIFLNPRDKQIIVMLSSKATF